MPFTSSKTITISALTDTGCQSCLAGINLLHKLGIKATDLIPVKTKMRSANNEGIRLLGAILLNLFASDAQGRMYSSNQMTYITDSTGTFFLSREACTDLGIISEKFPTIGEAVIQSVDSSAITSVESQSLTSNSVIAPCGCPKRTAPPPPPRPPVLLTDSNRLELEKFLLEYYASSTFNTCPHQPLPHMSGPPMELMIDPDTTTPGAHHKAISVPLHYADDV